MTKAKLPHVARSDAPPRSEDLKEVHERHGDGLAGSLPKGGDLSGGPAKARRSAAGPGQTARCGGAGGQQKPCSPEGFPDMHPKGAAYRHPSSSQPMKNMSSGNPPRREELPPETFMETWLRPSLGGCPPRSRRQVFIKVQTGIVAFLDSATWIRAPDIPMAQLYSGEEEEGKGGGLPGESQELRGCLLGCACPTFPTVNAAALQLGSALVPKLLPLALLFYPAITVTYKIGMIRHILPLGEVRLTYPK